MQPERWVEVADGYDTAYQRGKRPERYPSPTLDSIFRQYAPKEAREEWFKDTRESSSIR